MFPGSQENQSEADSKGHTLLGEHLGGDSFSTRSLCERQNKSASLAQLHFTVSGSQALHHGHPNVAGASVPAATGGTAQVQLQVPSEKNWTILGLTALLGYFCKLRAQESFTHLASTYLLFPVLCFAKVARFSFNHLIQDTSWEFQKKICIAKKLQKKKKFPQKTQHKST